MTRKKVYLASIFILVLAFFAANLVYPVYFNRAADFLNQKLPFNIPHFWNVPFKLGLDLQGGAHLLYQADLSNVDQKDKDSAMAGLRDVIERRINYFGVREPQVQVEGERLVVELAGVMDVSQAIAMIGQTPLLQFKEPKENYEAIIQANQEVAQNATGTFEDPFQETALTGQYLTKAEVGFDQTSYKPLVSLQFNDEGAKLFEEITARNIGKPLAIYVDQQLISAPVVEDKIAGGKAQISGTFTVDEAKELARNLNAGALPVPIKLISQQTVGPTLGQVSLERSLKAGLFGFLAVILFMIVFYRIPGLLASIALAIYIALVLAAFKLVGVTLTLAGIAGFILSIGMAVDANILIFARMREELKEGKDYSLALEESFRRAWPSIRDSNSNTLLVSAIFFAFGTSFVKGFAFTLILGVLLSMFSAIFITSNLLRLFKKKDEKKAGWLWR